MKDWTEHWGGPVKPGPGLQQYIPSIWEWGFLCLYDSLCVFSVSVYGENVFVWKASQMKMCRDGNGRISATVTDKQPIPQIRNIYVDITFIIVTLTVLVKMSFRKALIDIFLTDINTDVTIVLLFIPLHKEIFNINIKIVPVLKSFSPSHYLCLIFQSQSHKSMKKPWRNKTWQINIQYQYWH